MYSNYSLILNWLQKENKKGTCKIPMPLLCWLRYLLPGQSTSQKQLERKLILSPAVRVLQSIVAGRGQPQECEAVGQVVCIVGSSKRWRWELI